MSSEMKIPRTIEEKIAVLEDAYKKLEGGVSNGQWIEVIGDTHMYCLYGALQASMGLDHERWVRENTDDDLDYVEQTDVFSQFDKPIETCSLTTAMYQAAKDAGALGNTSWVKLIDLMEKGDYKGVHEMSGLPVARWYEGNSSGQSMEDWYDGMANRSLMSWKTNQLQGMNDSNGTEAVLSTVRQTIDNLKAKLPR